MAADWLYRYADGTTGATQFQRGADGGIVSDNGQLIGGPGGAPGGVWGLTDIAPQPMGAGYQGPPAGVTGSTFGGGGSPYAPTPRPLPGVSPMGPSGQMAYGSVNPFLAQMGQGMSDQMQKTFQRQTLPGIASGAAASGGFGSSRQGVLEANAMNDFSQNQGKALTDLYGQGYSQGLNYDLGVRNNNSANAANANQYDLGLRNNDLAYAGLDRQINNDNLNWQLQGAQLGLQGNQALQTGNAMGQTAAGNIQNTPLNYWQQFSNVANGFGQGYSTQTGTVNQQGSPLMGALGGAQLGSSLWNQYQGGNGAGGGAPASGNNYFGGSGGLGGFDNSAGGFGAGF